MGWEKIIKRRKIGQQDIKLVNYILRDGEFRTMDRIMDEIYDLIEENKKLGYQKVFRIEGRPLSIKFWESNTTMTRFMTVSPDYESRDTGKKTPTKRPIIEYRYIGEWNYEMDRIIKGE